MFVERGKFNSVLGVNALLPVHSPRILQTPSQDFENKSGYTGNFLNIVLKAGITRVNTVIVCYWSIKQGTKIWS